MHEIRRLRFDELLDLPLMVLSLHRHLTVMAGGVIVDTGGPSEEGRRRVLGWWAPEEHPSWLHWQLAFLHAR